MYSSDTRSALRPVFLVPVLFTATIFLSASLLFFVQPLFTKIVLPQIGGAPAVWTTAMLFFQSALIGGYLYAHLSTTYLSLRAQVLLHLSLWAVALTFLPLSIPEGWQYVPDASAGWQTLVLFGLGVGVPFGVLSANAPLIQSWYARSGGPSADDPYFLYGASNLGSLIALLAFPLVAEPLFGAVRIGQGWAVGFVALGGFLAASGLGAARGAHAAVPVRPGQDSGRPSLSRVGHWLLLAFIPSSLMLAITTKISTDIGAIPLVWVVPLSLYLLSFVLTFSRRPFFGATVLRIAYMAALGWLAVVFTGIGGTHLDLIGIAGLVASFFAVAMFAHTRLYDVRPEGRHLTLYYVVMSAGGALGGLFNSVLAPAVFVTLAEGGITTLLAAALILSPEMRLTLPLAKKGVAYGVIAAGALVLAVQPFAVESWLALKLIMFALAATVAFLLRRTVPAAALAAGLVAVVGNYVIPAGDIFRDRSFFGTHWVADVGGLRQYANGTTLHGAERLADYRKPRPEPLFYYHRNGPMAQVLSSYIGRAARHVGVVGLGVGSLACYRQPGQHWQFYEIDPVVDRIARNPAYFTFISACAGDAPTHLGDARMVLAAQEGLKYDLLVIDAYGSDSVPVHLTTQEAMQLYLDRLAPDGVLLYHITNRYYAIERPLSRSAAALGLEARLQDYSGNAENDPADSASRVVMLARHARALGTLAEDPRWRVLASDGGRIWTDDFANPLAALR